MGMTGRMLTDLVGDGRLTRFGGRFTSQVWPGDDLTTTMVVDSVREEDGQHLVELSVRTTNQDGRDVFTPATPRARTIPSRRHDATEHEACSDTMRARAAIVGVADAVSPTGELDRRGAGARGGR